MIQSSLSVAVGLAQDGGVTRLVPLYATIWIDPITVGVSLYKSISTFVTDDAKPLSLFSGYWQVNWSYAVCQLLAASALHPEVDPPKAQTLQSRPFVFLL